jgi:hypothetical protein
MSQNICQEISEDSKIVPISKSIKVFLKIYFILLIINVIAIIISPGVATTINLLFLAITLVYGLKMSLISYYYKNTMPMSKPEKIKLTWATVIIYSVPQTFFSLISYWAGLTPFSVSIIAFIWLMSCFGCFGLFYWRIHVLTDKFEKKLFNSAETAS